MRQCVARVCHKPWPETQALLSALHKKKSDQTSKHQEKQSIIKELPGCSYYGTLELSELDTRWSVHSSDFLYVSDTYTCLFTRLEGLAWSQQGFWQLSFCRNCDLWSVSLYGRNMVVLLFIYYLEERECVEMPGRMKNGHVSTFPFCPCKPYRGTPPTTPITRKASGNMFSAETGLSETLLGPG